MAQPQSRARNALLLFWVVPYLVAWIAVGMLVWVVRRQAGGIALVVLGIILFSCGFGFVIAPLMRLRMGRERSLAEIVRRRSFFIGLVLSVAGAAGAGWGFYVIVRESVKHPGLSAPAIQSEPSSSRRLAS